MIKKNKPLKPSAREKKRYVVFRVISEKKIKFDFSEIKKTIELSVKNLYGIKGLGGCGLIFFNQFYNDKGIGIIRVSVKGLEDLKSSILFIKKIKENDVIINVELISGMLKKGKEKFEELSK